MPLGRQEPRLLRRNWPLTCQVEKLHLPGYSSGDLQLWLVFFFFFFPCIFGFLGIERL